ncbi:MAG: calcium-binding protein [Methyloceanibacter sp.]|uniref:calcium-binding protein n=1 Tax=Methyloceanibacter sp. TaxID=1965321 RepID=UPI003D6D2A5D
MATVTFFQPATMSFLPTSGPLSVSQIFGDPGAARFEVGGQFVATAYGNISDPSPGSGLPSAFTSVIFDQGFGPAFQVTDMLYIATASYQTTGSLGQGNLLHLLETVLSFGDTITGTSRSDSLSGYGGNDVLIGGAGGDTLDGGSGNNTASYATAAAGLLANLESPGVNTGDALGDTYFSIQNLTGSNFADTLYGDGVANTLSGLGGNDRLVGKAGGDTFIGGSGIDTVVYDASAALRASLLAPGTNTGDAAGDTYNSIENLDGSSEDDILIGNNAANVIRGNGFPNLSFVDADLLMGMGGNDTLFGFDGNDVLTGGLGRDTLFGGPGADRFDFNSINDTKKGGQRDKIMDFSRSEGDEIDLKDIDAQTGGGNQAFTWIGKSKFHEKKGELRYIDKGATVIVQGDINGDGKADFEIFVNVGALAKGDFLL